MYQLLVFDWDGTLMDSQARIVACLQSAAVDLEITTPDSHQARDVIGLGLLEAVAQLFPDQDAAMHQRLADRYREHFLVLNQSRSELFPQAREVLHELAEKEYLMAVATGKSRRGLKRELEESGLEPLFHSTRCADEAHSKPHPQMLNDILDELGIAPHDALVIGDTEYDMQMASNAKTAALGVSFGVHEKERLLEQGALACIDTLPELPMWLSRGKENG